MLDPRTRTVRFLAERPWIVMSALVGFFLFLGMATVRLDDWLRISPANGVSWLYSGSADSAIGVLTAITGSSITVAGVIFSATYVALQVASSQYTPRVVQSITQNRRLEIVLGSFLGSFCYSLMVLRSIQPADKNGEGEFVPVLSVSMSIVLCLVSIAVFIYFVWFGITSLQPAALIGSAASHTFNLLDRAQNVDIPDGADLAYRADVDAIADTGIFLNSHVSGYLRHADLNRLYDLATAERIHIQIEVLIGSYIFKGEPLIELFGAERAEASRLENSIIDAIDIGEERTPDQDVDFGFRRVADIMLKALSPAINDPTTATYCFNKLCELVLTLSGTGRGIAGLRETNGDIRVSWKAEQFDRCVMTAFTQLRYYARNDSAIVGYMLRQFERLVVMLPENRSALVIEQATALRDAGIDAARSDGDRRMITESAAWIAD